MPRSSAASSVEIGELQRRMAQIRREMHEDVQGAVRGAQSLTDWRSIAGSHPWAALSVAVGVGYLLVPHRKSQPKANTGAIAEAPREQAIVTASSQTRNVGFRPVGAAFGLLAPVLIRAAQNYALNYFEQWLAAHPFNPRESDRGRRLEPSAEERGNPESHTVRFPDRR
jgi:hypothetical protein